MNERRDRFRQAMARFEPSGDPLEALSRGLYVAEPVQSVAQQILARLELRPQSSHLVTGPIGSGKTTQLRVLEKSLKESGEFWPIFADITTHGNELAAKGKLIKHVVDDLKKLRGQELAAGAQFSKGEGAFIVVLGLLALLAAASSENNPPSATVIEKDIKQELSTLSRKPVLLIDSLDRLSHPVFAELCDQDLAKLREHIAIVVVAPPAIMYGAARETAERFDYFTRQTAKDPREDPKMHAFLLQVIRLRAEEALLPETSCNHLVLASGGILRDLIALTQLALEEAYVAGHAGVEPSDVARAADTFGRKHIIGLDSQELSTLQRVRKHGTFVRVNDSDMGLLVTRRVLEYADDRGATRFAVHPTLIPLLEQLDV